MCKGLEVEKDRASNSIWPGYKSQGAGGAGEMIKEGDGSHGKSWDLTGQEWRCFEGLKQGRGVILV